MDLFGFSISGDLGHRLSKVFFYAKKFNPKSSGNLPEDVHIRAIEKRSSSVNFLVASIAIAFTVCFSIATFSYSYYAKTNQILPADITSLYAVKGREQPAVRNIPRADNSMLLHEWFGKSRSNIKIVSLTGISWLLNDQKMICKTPSTAFRCRCLLWTTQRNWAGAALNLAASLDKSHNQGRCLPDPVADDRDRQGPQLEEKKPPRTAAIGEEFAAVQHNACKDVRVHAGRWAGCGGHLTGSWPAGAGVCSGQRYRSDAGCLTW